jgi:hypothetical protein
LATVNDDAEAPVKKPPAGKYYATLERAQRLPGTSVPEALALSRSALEAMGLAVQSETVEVGTIRTKQQQVRVPEGCDCGTWNERPVYGDALAALVVTVDQRGADATVSADFKCDFAFSATTYWGRLSRMETYRCVSRGQDEEAFFAMLNRLAEVHKQQEKRPSTPPRRSGT